MKPAVLVIAIVLAGLALWSWLNARHQLAKMSGEAIHRAQVHALAAIFWVLALLTLAVFASGCASVYRVGAVDVEPTGGAGFAGIRTAVVVQEPALVMTQPGCTGRCTAVVMTDSVDLRANRHYEWRPALSTGVAFQHYTASGVGGGLGVNIVLVPGATGATAPWPALTAHLGTHQYGFFAGLVIAPTDAVAMPPGVSVLRVHRDHIPDLLTHHTGRAGTLVLGIRLGGKSATTDTTRAP